VSDYGYVWVPAVTVVDWAPTRRDDGFGSGKLRLDRLRSLGLGALPLWPLGLRGVTRLVLGAACSWQCVLGPGFVGWIVTPGYVAWVPLAPGEVYYGYGYYGPGSVNITAININTVVANRTT